MTWHYIMNSLLLRYCSTCSKCQAEIVRTLAKPVAHDISHVLNQNSRGVAAIAEVKK